MTSAVVTIALLVAAIQIACADRPPIPTRSRFKNRPPIPRFPALLAWLRLRDLSRTCSLQQIIEPSHNWPFPSNLTCATDRAFLTANNVEAEQHNLRCVYTYSCPLDPPAHRQARLECQKDGTWRGSLPDCSKDRLITYILSTSRPRATRTKRRLTRVTFKKICDAQKICTRFSTPHSCRNLRYNQRVVMRWDIQELRNLCVTCHVSFCSKSTKLL